MESKILWYTAYARINPKRITATYGVLEGQICAIAYHYDFKDFNRDGRTSSGEKFASFVTGGSSDEATMNLDIAHDFYYNVAMSEASSEADMNSAGQIYQKAVLDFINNAKTLTTKAIDFVYFDTLVGFGISQSLTAAGINGIKHFVYNKAVKSALKGIVKD